MRMVYVANGRIPTEKANGLQIVQMCEALANSGYELTLVAPRRINTPELRTVQSIWTHYGVQQNFDFRRLWCIDLFTWFPRSRITFMIQTISYLIALMVWLLPRRVDRFYTRDLWIAVVIALVRPRATLIYEVHQIHHSRLGRTLQRFAARRVHVIPLTGHMAQIMRDLGATRIQVEHDGVQLARFAGLPDQATARLELGLPENAFVVGYVGRLHTMHMSKGVDTVVAAIAHAAEQGTEVHFLLVGGPEEGIAAIREQWAALNLPPERLHPVGQIPPDQVGRALAAMDVGTLPLPWTQHFAYYASALKLFEYMAAGCVVLASDLPSTAEVVRDGESALLVPPGDVEAFAAAIQRLYVDRDLRQRLSACARAEVQRYSWQARADRIRQFSEASN